MLDSQLLASIYEADNETLEGEKSPSFVLHSKALVKDYFESRQEKFDPRDIRLSELGGCARKQVFRIHGYVAPEYTLEQRGVFEAGHVWEDWLAERWEERFPGHIYRNVEVHTEYGVGHIDILNTALPRIIECKSTKNTNKGLLPFKEHMWQLQCYLHFYGREHGITEGELSYILKNDFTVISYLVTYDPSLGKEIEAIAAYVLRAKEEGFIPPVSDAYSPKKFPCKWKTGQCGFYDRCW